MAAWQPTRTAVKLFISEKRGIVAGGGRRMQEGAAYIAWGRQVRIMRGFGGGCGARLWENHKGNGATVCGKTKEKRTSKRGKTKGGGRQEHTRYGR